MYIYHFNFRVMSPAFEAGSLRCSGSRLIASFLAMIVLPAVWSDPTSSQSTAEQNVDYAFFTILGCFVGVVAGKLTSSRHHPSA